MDESPVEITKKLHTGELPILDYLDTLESTFQAKERQIQAFLPEPGRFDRLRKEVKRLEEKYPDIEFRPPLFGIPIGIKDIFHVDGFITRAGSRVPPEELQGMEAESVRLLKQAGALMLGKTVTTEFAYFAPGPTRNPNNLNHTPGGSSSGSAAAVAAEMCPISLGTQTIGSIIRPASFCGIVGYKPTAERISREGVIPLSPSLDHVGFFTPDVSLALTAAPILMPDWDPLVKSIKPPVLGIPGGSYLQYSDPEGMQFFEQYRDRLFNLGFMIKTVNVLDDFDEIRSSHELILAAECAMVHKEWYARYGDCYHTKTAELINRGKEITAEELAGAKRERAFFKKRTGRQMQENGIDIWISPAAPGPAPAGLMSTGNPIMNLPWTYGGFPVINLPIDKNASGLPVGLQLTAEFGSDESLLNWAQDILKCLSS